MELLLIRHGLPQRVENSDGTPADPSLSPNGLKQAAAMAAHLADAGIEHIVASPLRRAHETALPLARTTGLQIEVDGGVVEFDQQSALYIPLEELKQTDYDRWLELMQGGLEMAVDFEAFRKTVVAAIEAIIARHPGKRVAIVCHGGVINSWASHILKTPAPFIFQPDYTSINRFLAARSGERNLVSLNETPHATESAGF